MAELIRYFFPEFCAFYGIIIPLAPVAQWIEYLTSNQLVARSSRAGGAIYRGKAL